MAPLDDQKPESERPYIEMERSGEGEAHGPMETHEDLVVAVERLQREGSDNFRTFAEHLRAELDDVEKSGTKGFRDFFQNYGRFRRRILIGLAIIVAGMVWALFAQWQNGNRLRETTRDQGATITALRALQVENSRRSVENRNAIRSLCATTAAIQNLDSFFLSLVPKKPPKNETARQKEIRERFVKLVKADLARMKGTRVECESLGEERR